jgi:hypothetical protein
MRPTRSRVSDNQLCCESPQSSIWAQMAREGRCAMQVDVIGPVLSFFSNAVRRIHLSPCVRLFLSLLTFEILLAVPTVAQQAQAPAVDPAAVLANVPPAAAPTNPTISITASPRVIQPTGGKLPASVNLAVFEKDCDSSKGISLAATPAYTLMVTGSGLSPIQPKSSKCVITTTLTIDPNTPPGTYSIILLDGVGTPVASTDLAVLDASAGTIPPGLPPEVDVMWEVMSQNNCADVFGTRVAASLYCIQLKIGNNAGHPLQLAGIGFTNRLKDLIALGGPYVTLANSSYASTRAVLLHQEMWSTRNVLYHSLEGAGLIMAGFTPFFRAANAKANFATATSILSGPLLQAFNIISPDPVISQLNNLDDQSFRDNVVIPNNAQVQTTVFVEKQALTDSLRNLQVQLTHAAAAARQDIGTESKTRTQTQEVAALNADVLLKLANASTATVSNSTGPLFQFRGKHDPLLVKLALGSVVIVGQTIEYLQRVQVQSNASGASANGVTVTPATVSLASSTGASPTTQQFTAKVANDPNGAGVTWALSGPNCQASTCGTLSSPTATTVTYTAPNARPAPDNTVTLTATSKADTTKSGTAMITITPPAISVAIAPNPPPASTHGGAGTSFTVTVANDSAALGVNWSLSGPGCAGLTCGTLTAIAPTGVTYTPPTAKPNPSTVTLTATSSSDPTKVDTVTITIN